MSWKRRRSRRNTVLSRRRCARWLALSLLLTCFAYPTASSASEAVFSKSRRFRIPFQFDATELQKLGAKEVQLFVSRNSGEWRRADSVAPEAGKFTFEAPSDGEFSFSVKTIVAGNLEYPAGPHQAGLTVIIDSTPPELELTLDEVEPGRVRLSWTTSDDHLDVTSLKLEFTDPANPSWQPVAVRGQEQGQTIWTVAQAGELQVRGSISDLAGNITEATADVFVSAFSSPENSQPDFSRPVASEPSSLDLSAIPSQPPLNPQTGSGQIMHPAATSQPSPNLIHSAQTNSVVATPEYQTRKGHLVNSTTFRIGYEVEDVGPSGISKVDVYITEDRGRRWFHYGPDVDRTSPMEVTVPEDGEYGFAFRITNGLGLAANPPQPGDPPEVTVIVDRVAPIAQLRPLRHGEGPEAGQVLIEWSVQDRELHEQPIALYYATQPTGTWEAIQGWQPNTGRFLWTVPNTVEQKIYIRLEARDAAGNVTRVDAPEPFLVDRSRPRARVTEVESLHSQR